MTSVLERPAQRHRRPPLHRRYGNPPVRRAAATAALAVGAGLGLVMAGCLLAWIAESRTAASVGDVLRTAAAIWLLAQRGMLTVGAAEVSVTPLGITLILGGVLCAGGRSLAKHACPGTASGAATLGLALAMPYALFTFVIAALVSGDVVAVGLLSAFVGSFGLAALAGAAGAMHSAGVRPVLPAAIPRAVREAVVPAVLAAGAAVAVLAGSAVVMVLGSLLAHGSQVASMLSGSGGGAVGAAGLALVSLALLPNAVACGMALIVGPGFAVGSGTVVSISEVRLGAVPGLPLLAALPAEQLAWASGLPVLAAVAGLVGGWVAARRYPCGRWHHAAGLGLSVGILAGLCVALAGRLAAGSAGAARLVEIGPPWLPVGAAATLLVGLPAALVLMAAQRRNGPAPAS